MNKLSDRTSQSWRDMTAIPLDLTRSVRIEEDGATQVLGFGVIIMMILIMSFMIWAGLAPIDEVTSASGQIMPSGYVQSVQNLDGGMVRGILVEEGQIVQAGQVLLRLDPTNANADLGQLKARQDSLLSQIARYRSFTSGNMTEAEQLNAPEREILQSMRQSRDSQHRVLADQLAQKQKELNAYGMMRQSLEKNMRLTKEEAGMYESMAAKGAGSRMMVLSSERDVNQLRAQLDETISSEKQARDAISEIRSRMVSLDADLKQEALKTMGQLEAELREVVQSLDKAAAASQRTTVTAPVDGIVKGLSVHTIGAVVQPGQLLLEIVPVDSKMIAEVSVSPADIGHVRVGQEVRLKISTYDFARYGSLPGQVMNVSATTFQTADDETFYKVKIRLMQDHVGADPLANRVAPGMTLQANIVTGEKTVLQYLLKPVQYALDDAFHEA